MVYHLAMTEDSTPYRLSNNREPLGDERPISLALTRSEWIELKIALNNEIDRIQDDKYLASRIERLQQLRVRLRNNIE